MNGAVRKAADQFRIWYEERHAYAADWKANSGGVVVGGFCTYVPEELLYAIDILPVRILGSHEPQDVSEPHLFGMFCPFSRDALAQGLKGRYNYVDSIVIAHSCLHFRQAFASWKEHLPVKWSYYLPMPNAVQSPHAFDAYLHELVRFREFLENATGSRITSEGIEEALLLLDENRRLLRAVYEWRKGPDPLVTGTDAMYMAVTSQFIHKRDHNRALKELLDALERSTAERDLATGNAQADDHSAGIRLMAVGSENDDAEFFKMVESLGATVVIDEQCAGTRYFWNESPAAGDPLTRIANRYLDRPPCPTKDYPARRRFPHILHLAQEYGAQGVLIMQEKFCDPHEADNPALRAFLEESGLPTLLLEFDSTNPLGPLRIRVEAFLETLRGEELFA